MHPRGELLCVAGTGFIRICQLEASQRLKHAAARLDHCAIIGSDAHESTDQLHVLEQLAAYAEAVRDAYDDGHVYSAMAYGTPVKVETLVDFAVSDGCVEALLMDRSGKHLAAVTPAVVHVWCMDPDGLRNHMLNSAPACKVRRDAALLVLEPHMFATFVRRMMFCMFIVRLWLLSSGVIGSDS
jgi:hypothetical protein